MVNILVNGSKELLISTSTTLQQIKNELEKEKVNDFSISYQQNN